MTSVLMHTCCAPCSLSCIDPLRAEGIVPVAFWYNPNIHPWKEYEARRDCLLNYAPTIGMRVIVEEDYGLREFVEHVAGDISHRCTYCYHHRLEETARYAAEHGYRYMLTIDSDGQHYASDIPKFVEEIAKTPDALLVGARNLRSDNMPGKNTFANKFSNFWFLSLIHI